MEEWRYYLFYNYCKMKTLVQILQKRVQADKAIYKWKKVLTLDWDEAEFIIWHWYSVHFADISQILFWYSNFWEVMYDNDYFIDYLPATQVCNEIDAHAPLWYKACCAVSDDYLEFLNKIVK